MSLISTMFESYCTILRPTIGRDNVSGVTQRFNRVVARNLPCSITMAGTQIQDLYAQRDVSVSTSIFFAQNPQAQVNDLIQGTDRTGDTLTYQIHGQCQTSVGRARLWRADCAQIQLIS